MTRALLLMLLLAACGGEEPDTDVVPDDTGDTGEDIPDSFLGFTEKPSDVERPSGLRAGLLPLTIEEDGSWTVEEPLAGGGVSGTGNFGIELPDGPIEGVVDLPGGRRGALFLPIIYQDANNDDTFRENTGESLLGYAHDRWAVWLETAAEGEPTGWVVVDPTVDGWTIYRRTEQAVIRLLGLGAVGRLEGLYGGADQGLGVMGIDERRLTGGEASDWVGYEAPVEADNGNRFVAVADGRPPVGAFQFPDGGLRYVRLATVFFEDLDGDGAHQEGEPVLPRAVCLDEQPVVARYSDTPETVAVARELDALGWTSGWRFVTGPPGAEVELDRAEIRWTTYGDDCTFSWPD
jgi:hypothetical protein